MPAEVPTTAELTAIEARLAEVIAAVDAENDARDANLASALSAVASAVSATNAAITSLAARVGALEETPPVDPPVDPPPVDPPPVWKPAFAGDVASGTLRWGAAVGGNADPKARWETPAGRPLGVRRTFFAWTGHANLLATVKADHAAGRLPWVSTKTLVWSDMATGSGDAQFSSLITALKATGKPVWLTVHHEPEGDGTASDYRAMQARLFALKNALGATNVAMAPILMSWSWEASVNRWADWWTPDACDFVGIDHYAGDANYPNKKVESFARWQACLATIKAAGKKVAVGEWGTYGTDPTLITSFYQHCLDQNVAGVAYFDSALNSPAGSWELKGALYDEFVTRLKDARSVTL